MSNSVTIKVPARLHLGFLDLSGDAARRFGSLGLPLSEPETVVTLSHARETSAEGPDAARAAEHLKQLSQHLGIRTPHRLVIERAIPPHAGLGSGTQIAIAVAAALRTLHQLPLDTAADAILLGRGERSGIGIAIAANKIDGVRAATVHDVTSARLAREHNDANVMCLGERFVGEQVALDALDAFLTAAFEGGRHTDRVAKITALEN